MIRTAYELPFAVSHPTLPFFASGDAVLLEVKLREGVTSTDADRVAGAVKLFVDLANTGALAGRSIEPWHSGASFHPVSVVERGQLGFSLDQCRFDDAGLVVLCDILLHSDNAPFVKSIAAMKIGVPSQPLACDPSSFSTYPDRFAHLPYPCLEEESESGTYSFSVTLASALDDRSREALRCALTVWSTSVRAGGFALAPLPPSDNYVEPDEPLVEYGVTVEWAAFRLRAHPSALDALVNAFAAFHRRYRTINALTIAP